MKNYTKRKSQKSLKFKILVLLATICTLYSLIYGIVTLDPNADSVSLIHVACGVFSVILIIWIFSAYVFKFKRGELLVQSACAAFIFIILSVVTVWSQSFESIYYILEIIFTFCGISTLVMGLIIKSLKPAKK